MHGVMGPAFDPVFVAFFTRVTIEYREGPIRPRLWCRILVISRLM